MAREFRFRAWDTHNERMVDDPYRFDTITDYKIKEGYKGDHIFYEDWQDVDDGIDRGCYLMQYTGIPDINGKYVFEHDVVQGTFGRKKQAFQGVVKWDNDGLQWIVSYKSDWMPLASIDNIEVIGNIYQHPNLLNV